MTRRSPETSSIPKRAAEPARPKAKTAAKPEAESDAKTDNEAEYSLWAREMVRSLRGPRSARAFSALLGFKSDVVSRWESGARDVLAADVLRAIELDGHSPWERLRRFDAMIGATIERHKGNEHDRIAALLRALCEHRTSASIATALGFSARSADRLLRGEFKVRLSTLLLLLEEVSGRAVDFVLTMLDGELSPSLRAWTSKRRTQQQASVDVPLAEAVLALMRSERWKQRSVADALWLCERLQLPREELQRTLDALVERGIVERRGLRYEANAVSHVDLSTVDLTRETSKFWFREAARRGDLLPQPHQGWLVHGTTQANARRIYATLRRAYQEVLDILREGAPSERVELLTLGIFPLDGEPLDLT